jgi:hypothetical protein
MRTFVLAVVLGFGLTAGTRVEGGVSDALACIRDIVGDRTLNCAIRCDDPCGTARACIRSMTRQIRQESARVCTYLRDLSKPSTPATADADARAALPEEINLTNHASAMRSLWLDLESATAIARRRCR